MRLQTPIASAHFDPIRSSSLAAPFALAELRSTALRFSRPPSASSQSVTSAAVRRPRPSTQMSKRKAEQLHPDGEEARPASLRRSARLLSAAAAIAAEVQRPAAAASTGAPFQRLATVELQLVMQHCDLSTLLLLARCSRFTLSSASHPFAWRALSPLSFSTTVARLGGRLRGSRLLAHCDVALRWLPPTNWWRQAAVENAELAAIESMPRLVELDTCSREVKSAELRRLLSHPALTGLTALHSDTRQMDNSCTTLLPLQQPRLRTLSLLASHNSTANQHLLAPLARLHALTDLSLDVIDMDESSVEIISRCASLRRLHLLWTPMKI